MTPFALFLIIGALMVFAFYYFARMGQKEADLVATKAADILRNLDDQYESFIEQKLLIAAKEQEMDLDVETITEEAMLILKPNIEGLLAHMNANKTYGGVNVQYYSRYFKNIVPTVDAYFLKSYQNKSTMFTEREEERFSQAFEGAIISDLKQRLLELKSGS
ncbi:MAG: hypothetical protein AAF502_22935 [Bacteroidota bacterium]